MASKKHEFKTISIPKQLHAKVEELIDGTGFHNVSAFTTYMLRQMLTEKEEKEKLTEAEEKVKQKLKKLGYL